MPHIATIQLEQIEAPGAQVLALAIHQRIEVRLAVAVTSDKFGVDDGRCCRQAQHLVADHLEPLRHVHAVAAEHHDAITGLVKLHSPAVELDLVNPLRPDRRLALQHRGRGGYEGDTLWHGEDVAGGLDEFKCVQRCLALAIVGWLHLREGVRLAFRSTREGNCVPIGAVVPNRRTPLPFMPRRPPPAPAVTRCLSY